MTPLTCPHCSRAFQGVAPPGSVVVCPHCGARVMVPTVATQAPDYFPVAAYQQPARNFAPVVPYQPPPPQPVVHFHHHSPAPGRSRLAYILLALFLGHLGVHNFYAGRTGAGVGQLCLFVLSWPLMLVLVGFVTVFVPTLWAWLEIIIVDRDGYGRVMA